MLFFCVCSACTRPASTPPFILASSPAPEQSAISNQGVNVDEGATQQPGATHTAWPALSENPLLAGTAATQPAITPTTYQSREVSVTLLTLPAPLNRPQAELSGLDWYDDELILLPQYPERYAESASETGALFAVSQSGLVAAISQSDQPELAVRRIPLFGNQPLLSDPGYEGFEAIAISGEQVFFLIESRAVETRSWLCAGWIEAGLQAINLQPAYTQVPLNTSLPNLSAETLVLFGNRLLAIPEVNVSDQISQPQAALFDFNLQEQNRLAFPALPYRITDASRINDSGQFWVLNYYFPEEPQTNGVDPLQELFPPGASHLSWPQVERLVALQFSESGVVLAETPPLWLSLSLDGEARNWEGLAELPGLGFILVTDRYPETILGFLPYASLPIDPTN